MINTKKIQGILHTIWTTTLELGKRLLRLSVIVPLVSVVVLLLLVTRYDRQRFIVPRGTTVQRDDRGRKEFVRRLQQDTQARIIRWDYDHYYVRFDSGEKGYVSDKALRIRRTLVDKKTGKKRTVLVPIPNKTLWHFFPKVFSKNHKEYEIPFAKERHTVRYIDEWLPQKRPNYTVYERLVFPFSLLLALTFIMAFGGRVLKTATAIIFFTVLTMYALYVTGNESKAKYGWVSYFRQVSIRIPAGFKGWVFVPDTQWLIRVKGFLGLKNRVKRLGERPDKLQGAYVVTGGGRGGADWTFIYSNNKNLYYVDGYFDRILKRIPDDYKGLIGVPHRQWVRRMERFDQQSLRMLNSLEPKQVTNCYLIQDDAWGEAPQWMLEKMLHPDHLPRQLPPPEGGLEQAFPKKQDQELFLSFYRLQDDGQYHLTETTRIPEDTIEILGRYWDGNKFIKPVTQPTEKQRTALSDLLRRAGYGWKLVYANGPGKLFYTEK